MPLKVERIGRPDDIDAAVAFIASPGADYIRAPIYAWTAECAQRRSENREIALINVPPVGRIG